MKHLIRLLLTLLMVTNNHAMSMPTDEALIGSAHIQGINIYNSCIVVPPANPSTLAYCKAIYITYTATLRIINSPFPLTPSLDPSPYSRSPFDICLYEVAHMIFNSAVQAPYYCPTV